MKRLFCICAGLILAAAASPGQPARANFLISTLAQPVSTAAAGIENGRWEGVGFQTDANTYQLSDAVAQFQQSPGAATDLRMELRSDLSDSPDALLATLTSATQPPGLPSNVAFTPTSPVILQPSTTYWLTTNITTGSVAWSGTGIVASTGPGSFASPFFFAGSFDNGASWTSDFERFALLYQVDVAPVAAAVPEPPGAVLMGLGLTVLASRARARRARAAMKTTSISLMK